MTSRYSSWPKPARTLAEAVDAGVSAAQAADAPAFASALTALARANQDQLVMVLGTLTHGLVERHHPDGFDSDDVSQILTRCVESSGWYAQFDIDALVRALTDLLGVSDADNQPDVAADAVLAHGIIFVTDLLAERREPLPALLDSALQELEREQTMELP